MATKLLELFLLLSSAQRRSFLILQLLLILMAILEVVGVASIAPFMALISDITIIEGENILATIYKVSGATDPQDFVFYVGLIVLMLLSVSSIVSMYTVWVLSRFGQETGVSIGNRLFEFYLGKSWLFHASGSSSTLTKQIVAEASRVTNGIIMPFMQLNLKIITAVFLSVALLVYDPLASIFVLMIFASLYLFLYKVVRYNLLKNGRQVSRSTEERFKLMSEGFGGIKDVLLLRRQANYVDQFKRSGHVLAHHQGTTLALVQVPRYFMEVVAFGTVIIFSLYLLKTHDNDIGKILPVLSVYALAGLKLLPAFQQTYASMALIQGNISAFDFIKKDLVSSNYLNENKFTQETGSGEKLVIKNNIELANIHFTYPGKPSPALNGLDMAIPSNKVIGLVGASGSGKSTLIDILLGLVKPDNGQLLIDGQPLKFENMGAWQDRIGFVPQSIFLSDASIMENIAFGLPMSDIDLKQIQHAIRLSHLEELIAELPDGFRTRVGERGVQLSGGQRQRIGIARALYHNAEILILDEATSSLDSVTEKLVMDAIHDFSGSKTIIMIAHRLTTVQKCDIIYFIQGGKVVDHGCYEDLIKTNINFKKMANLSS